jgi:hypothetical protein
MLKIKDPVLVAKNIVAIYNVDVGGTNIEVCYAYDMDEEGKGGWDYDLTPCYENLTDEEIEDLEEQFEDVICDIGESKCLS